MEWFRFYHDAVDDPKVQRLSPQLFKHWINILCLSSRNSERGTLPCVADLAFGLRLGESKVRTILGELHAAGLLDRDGETCLIHGWTNRQKRSDDVAARVHRHRYGNEGETLHVTGDVTLPHVRAIETETETDTELTPQPPRGPEYSAEFEERFWAHYPKGRGSKAVAFKLWKRLTAAEKDAAVASLPLFAAGGDWQRGFHKAPEVWLRGRMWENPPPTSASNGLPQINWDTASPEEKAAYTRQVSQENLRHIHG